MANLFRGLRRRENGGFDAVVRLVLEIAKPVKVQRPLRPVPKVGARLETKFYQKRL